MNRLDLIAIINFAKTYGLMKEDFLTVLEQWKEFNFHVFYNWHLVY